MKFNDSPRILILSTPKKRDYEVGLYNYLQSMGFNVNIIKSSMLVVKVGRDKGLYHRNQNIKNRYDVVIPFIEKNYDLFYDIMLHIFEEEGIDTYITTQYLKYTRDSNLLLAKLDRYDVSTFKTYIAINDAPLSNIVENLEYPIMIKTPYNGKNIIVKSKESLSSILDTIEIINKNLIIKEIFPNMTYEKYLYIDGYIFGLQKKGEQYIKTDYDNFIKDISKHLFEITKSKILLFSVYRDENNKAYFDDILIPSNIQKFIDEYGNDISLALSKSFIKDKGIGAYIKWIKNALKVNYFLNKKLK